jgi:hypothetical protein
LGEPIIEIPRSPVLCVALPAESGSGKRLQCGVAQSLCRTLLACSLRSENRRSSCHKGAKSQRTEMNSERCGFAPSREELSSTPSLQAGSLEAYATINSHSPRKSRTLFATDSRFWGISLVFFDCVKDRVNERVDITDSCLLSSISQTFTRRYVTRLYFTCVKRSSLVKNIAFD